MEKLNKMELLKKMYSEVTSREIEEEDVAEFEKCGYLTENGLSNGDVVYWHLDNEWNIAISLETGKIYENIEE